MVLILLGKKLLACVPQGTVLGPLLFLMYINDLRDDISSVWKMFADDTSLFSKVKDSSLSISDLNYDLESINQWTYQWKMLFNPDPNKQATVVLFSRKVSSDDHTKLTFNGNQVQQCLSQKHLGLFLDNKLDFNKNLDEKINKRNKIIRMMKKPSTLVSRQSLLTIYKSFARPILEYGDIIYDKPHKAFFMEKIERVQYNVCFVITGAFKGTSRERLYQKLGLESLKGRRCHRKLCFFYKIVKGLSPKYLTSYLQLHNNPIYQTRSTAKNIVKLTASRTVNFNNSFFPLCSQEWNNLSDDIKSLPSPISFKKALLRFVKTSENSVFAIHDNNGIKLLTRLRLNFSHLNEHKFRHNFLDTLNPMCSCGSEPETTAHFLLRCQNHVMNRSNSSKMYTVWIKLYETMTMTT